jgi:hypothetical protein
MPSVSAKQHRLMAAVASNPAVAKKTKIPQSVGKEFMEADKGKKFKGGGEMKESKAMVKKEIGFMKKKGAPKSMIKHEMAEAGMKKGGVKKMGFGGFLGGVLGGGAKAVKKAISNSPAKTLAGGVMAGKSRPLRDLGDGRPPKPKAGSPFAPGLGPRGATVGGGRPAPRPMPIRDIGTGSMPRPGGIPKPGGMGPRPPSQVSGRPVGLGRAMSKPPAGPVAKKIAGAGAGMARALMGKKAGGLAAGHKAADGIAKKGKTKAEQVKMAGGGKTKKYC